MLNFSFYSYPKMKSTIRINSNNDVMIIILKLILVLQNLLIRNEYCSLIILILVSIVLFFNCYYESTYNIQDINIAINMKNIIIMWSYFVCFLSKMFKNFNINGFFYLLLYGLPLNIYLSIIISKEKNCPDILFNMNIHNPKDYIKNGETIIN